MIWTIVCNILTAAFAVWFLNCVIDLLFDIDLIAYIKVWIDCKLISMKNKKGSDSHE